MTAAGIALIIGFLVCIGAVLGLGSTLRPLEGNEYSDPYHRRHDQASLVMAFILGIVLLSFVLSGRYTDPGYVSVKQPAGK